MLRLGEVDGTSFLHVKVAPTSPAAGHRISELELPQECLIISVRRGRKLHMAHGYTMLESGDRVTIFSDSDCLPEVRKVLTGQSVDGGRPR